MTVLPRVWSACRPTDSAGERGRGPTPDTGSAAPQPAGLGLARVVLRTEPLARGRDVEIAEVGAAEGAAGGLRHREPDGPQELALRRDENHPPGAPLGDPQAALGI